MILPATSISGFGGLFNNCTTCPAFAACGGAKTAPCGCAWKASSGFRHKCSECSLVCRDRREPGPGGIEYLFEDYLAEGRFLEQLTVQQQKQELFPLYVPLLTHFNKKYQKLPVRWAAANVNALLNSRKYVGAVLKESFNSESTARQFLSVKDDCDLWAIFNGKDDQLESFWGMGTTERSGMFTHLSEIGFSLATSATFSISDLTHRKTPTPQAHNVVMQTRHHQVSHELQAAGLDAVPNIYWRDGERSDIHRWARWLIENPDVHTISRDFTSTRRLPTAIAKMNELMQLLELVKRPFHIIIVGTGVVTAPKLMQTLNRQGHTATIVATAPIYDAGRCAVRYEFDGARSEIVKRKDGDTPRSELILNNMRLFEQMLSEGVTQEIGANTFLQNVL